MIKRRRLTSSEFIKNSKEMHDNKYDYSLVEYNKMTEKIKIICPKHGIFEQIPINHLKGCGCLKCHFDNIKDLYKSNTNEFIQKARKVHNDRYDYSLTEYIKNSIKIKIICSIHGEFLQTPNNHLHGFGCKKCAVYEQHLNQISNTKEWIEKVRIVHDNKYDYSLVEYEKCNKKVKIICKKHAIFQQTPNNHLRGQGCPICNNSKGEIKIRTWLEENNIKFEEQKRYSDCRGIKYPLPFDFYLPEHNTCIEFDGEGHYMIIDRSKNKKINNNDSKNKSIDKFITTIINDQIKNEYCMNNKIKLIRIPYWNFRNINITLEQIINIEVQNNVD